MDLNFHVYSFWFLWTWPCCDCNLPVIQNKVWTKSSIDRQKNMLTSQQYSRRYFVIIIIIFNFLTREVGPGGWRDNEKKIEMRKSNIHFICKVRLNWGFPLFRNIFKRKKMCQSILRPLHIFYSLLFILIQYKIKKNIR